MLYTMLIYQAEAVSDSFSPEDQEKALAGHRALQEETKATKKFVAANELMPATAATTVAVRAGHEDITDGPFAETKELLIGFYILDCADLDEAVARAKQIPHCFTGHIEIRPVKYYDATAVDGAAA